MKILTVRDFDLISRAGCREHAVRTAHRTRISCDSANRNVYRRGTSLVEVVVAMSVATVILSLSVGTIHLLLRAERNTARSVWIGSTLSRVSQLFPRDAHAAGTAEVLAADAEQGARLQFKLPDGHSVQYAIDAHSLTRTALSDNNAPHRDVFHFSPGTLIRFERESRPDLVAVIIERPTGKEGSRILRIDAILGRDHRFNPRQPQE